ncbi:MAG: anthranilate/aminodeoxychorismate synthase component II, partial [Chlorobium sp.]
MILVVDNYDSFTYNLVQYIGETGETVEVCRNDELSIEAVIAKNPAKIVISPGPGTPDDAGISVSLVHAVKGKIPLLGVCLGHQSIGVALG